MQIKFNAWNTEKNEMWDCDKLILNGIYLAPSGVGFVSTHFDLSKLKYLIPLQFSGIFDKNGKEIYDKHIVKTYSADDGDLIELVVFQRGKFITKHPMKLSSDVSDFKQDYIEIIGNLYEHPHLLK